MIRRVRGFVARYLRATALVAHSFTFGVASKRGRHLIGRLAREAGYREGPAPRLPRVANHAVASAGTTVVLPFPEATDGNVTLMELLIIATLTRERAPETIFEIGTFNGRTTATLAANAPQHARVFTLDLPAEHATRFALERWERAYVDKPVSGELLQQSPYRQRIVQLHGDSATFDFSNYAADFVFVDGSHTYDYVRNDSERALALLRNGRGLVLWHDYGEWEGVTRALNELHDSDPRYAGLRHVDGTTLAMLELS